MTFNKHYEPPRILSQAAICTETAILHTSVADAVNLGGVDVPGQATSEIEITDTNFFKHEWK